MSRQEMSKLLEELLHSVQTIRAVQVQFLAESDREPEDKLHFRTLANTAWKQFHTMYKQLTEESRQTEAAQEE